MKKFLLITMLFFSALTMMADDEQKIDATKISKITFNGDDVIITFNDGTSTKTYDMSKVTLDFTNATSIEERMKLSEEQGLEGKPVYDLDGKLVGRSAATLKKGVYIIDKKKVVVE